MTFKIYTLGCKVNYYDSNALKKALIVSGMKLADKNADIAIINTCSVTKIAQKKDRQMVVKAKNENPNAKIIMMGCYVKTYKEEMKKIKGVDKFWPVGKINELVTEIKNEYFKDLNRNFHSSENQVFSSERSRYFIKIQDGCEQFCTYCIIPYARGPLQSRDKDEIISEIKNAIASGYKEIVLSGIHLGLYGKESKHTPLIRGARGVKKVSEISNPLNPPCQGDLFSLLHDILKIKNLGRIRLSSIEVTEVTDELIALMKNEKRICKHLHIPLQSGCDKILKRMNRPYDTKYFENKIRKIRKIIPNIAITTDVIVGFPGETDKDFKETENFIKKINFSELHVFSFSAHEKTAAAKMDGMVDPKIIKARSEKLRKLSLGLEKKYQRKFKNKIMEVVIKGGGDRRIVGKTEYFFDIYEKMSKGNDYKVGDLVRIRNK